MSKLNFALLRLGLKIRDVFLSPDEAFQEADIKPGHKVLDYACGPGGFTFRASKIVGAGGKVYALDISPAAVEHIKKTSKQKGLSNIETIISDCKTGLEDSSLDRILFYDAFHDINNTSCVLGELHRVLKPDGIMSFSDHHLKDDEIIKGVTAGGFFKMTKKGKKTHSFVKA